MLLKFLKLTVLFHSLTYLFFSLCSYVHLFAIFLPYKKAKRTKKQMHVVLRTKLMANKWTAFDRREAENKSISLDAFRFQSWRTPFVLTQLLLTHAHYTWEWD